MYDLLIRSATICDGTGQPPFLGDLAVSEGRVAAVGHLGAALAQQTWDVDKALLTPGFVDLHTHYDLCLDWTDLSSHCLRQGITTVVGGNCGLGAADLPGVLAHAERAQLGVHFGVLAPLGPLRSRVVPQEAGRAAQGEELRRVEEQVAAALDAGALGVSWGPYHANSLMDDQELRVALTVAARRNKPFCVHRRSEGQDSLEATTEVIELAEATGVRAQISHLKAAGRLSWPDFGRVLERIEDARRGLDVAVDVYPYDASLTYLAAVLPCRLKADGRIHELLSSPAGFAQACAQVERWFEERMGPQEIVLLEPPLPEIPRGSTLLAASEALGEQDPAHTAVRLIQADPQGTGGWAIYREMMSPAQVEQVLDLPYAAVASDAVPEADGQGMCVHPRAFATFARAVLRAQALGPEALADTIRRCTRFPAERMNLDRGRLIPGAPADLVVLRDLDDRADFSEPARYPAGVDLVVVGGQVALQAGELVSRAGQVLRT